MSRGAKIFMVILVMGCGIGVATLFRHSRSLDGSRSEGRFAGLNFRSEANSESSNAQGQNFGALGSAGPSTPQRLSTAVASTGYSAEQTVVDQPPPRLPRSFGEQASPSTQTPAPATNPNLGSLLDGRNWPSLGPRNGTDPPVARELRGHEHKIRDGDTLARLAERFLGDPRRAGEIFEANRHLLADPEVLPLGLTIRIPPKVHARPVPAVTQEDSSSPAAADDPAAAYSAYPPGIADDPTVADESPTVLRDRSPVPAASDKPIPLFDPNWTMPPAPNRFTSQNANGFAGQDANKGQNGPTGARHADDRGGSRISAPPATQGTLDKSKNTQSAVGPADLVPLPQAKSEAEKEKLVPLPRRSSSLAP